MSQDLCVTYIDPSLLKRRKNNPRIHSKKQIGQIEASIREFGFLNPILVTCDLEIIAGHGRADAAIEAGLNQVPTVRVDHLTKNQIRAYVVADNKLAENAGWNQELLRLELQELDQDDYDLTVIGFEDAALDALLQGGSDGPIDAADTVPVDQRDRPPVSRLGDLWHFGDHRLLCGDASDTTALDRLLEDEKAQCVFTDPPYNVPINGHVTGLGKHKHTEFAMAAGEMSSAEFTDFLTRAFQNLAQHSLDGSIHFVCMDWRHLKEILEAGAATYSELKNLCVWAKSNGGMGSLYRSRHELVFVFKNGSASHLNNVELGKNGRYRTNVWEYPGLSSFGEDRQAELKMHPTVKPVALVSDAILDCSKRGGLVLDTFAGSGTTLIAAEKTGRRGYGCEIDPYYVDTIIRRFASVYGTKAMLSGPDLSFADIQRSRALKVGASGV